MTILKEYYDTKYLGSFNIVILIIKLDKVTDSVGLYVFS